MARSGSGWLDLAIWLNCCSRVVVGWDQRRPLEELLYEDSWGTAAAEAAADGQGADRVAAPTDGEKRPRPTAPATRSANQ